MKTHPDNPTQAAPADQPLKGIRHLNKLILESAGEGVYGLDLEGKATFVDFVSKRMTGLTIEESLGDSPNKLKTVIDHVCKILQSPFE